MTVDTNAATEAATSLAAENLDARQSVTNDNPNPDFGNPTGVPDAPPAENVNHDDAPPQLSKREQIVANARARRAETNDEGGDAPFEDLVTNQAGEYIPPFLRRQQEAEAARLEQEAQDAHDAQPQNQPRSFTLKVRGNDIPVVSRGELIKLAEVEDDEADDMSDAQLIKLAQKQVAASQVLDEAKAAKKIARAAAPDEGDTQPASHQQHNEPDLDDDEPAPAQPNPDDRRRQLIEKIQFGDPEEATQAFTEAVSEGVRSVVAEQEFSKRHNNVINIIKKAGDDFEAANADLVSDPDYADILYNRAFVAELKKDLVGQGLLPENVDAVVGNDVRTAMKAYANIAADGRVKTRAPNQMLAAAAQAVRQKFNRPAPPSRPGARTTAARPTTAPMSHRQDAKRQLQPQPARTSAPTQSGPVHGQAPVARSNAVMQMRKARGQA